MVALKVIPRVEFIQRRFAYEAGDHVTVVGPTGCGKSHLVYQLLDQVAEPELPALSLVKKPIDTLIERMGRELKFQTTPTWPPPWNPLRPRRPRGWLIWPETQYDPDIDRPHKAGVFASALLDSYKRGKRVVYVDDAYGISEILKLREILIELWTEMRSTKAGLWAAFQRPANVPLWAYSQAEHLILFKDPDKRARLRFEEIGGVDPGLVQAANIRLEQYQALYIKRTSEHGPRICVIDK